MNAIPQPLSIKSPRQVHVVLKSIHYSINQKTIPTIYLLEP